MHSAFYSLERNCQEPQVPPSLANRANILALSSMRGPSIPRDDACPSQEEVELRCTIRLHPPGVVPMLLTACLSIRTYIIHYTICLGPLV